MSIDTINDMIDKALYRGRADANMQTITNAINAEYALGKCYALMDIIKMEYGIDELITTRDRVSKRVDDLMNIVNKAYEGR